MRLPLRRSMRVLALAASAAIAFSCAQSPTAPSATNSSLSASSGDGSDRVTVASHNPGGNPGDLTTSTPVAGQVKVCKVFAAGSDPAVTSAQFAIADPGGSTGAGTRAASPLTVDGGTCRIAAESEAVGAFFNVSVNETVPATAQSIECVNEVSTPCGFADGGTVGINDVHGIRLTYTNFVAPPPPPPGDAGCTPGYWKNHLGSWAGYAPNASFNGIFGIGANWFPNSLTLLAALQQGGGGEKALARHAVAALLNAASAGVDYPLTTAQVIAGVQAAYNGTQEIGTVTNQLAGANELGCTLN